MVILAVDMYIPHDAKEAKTFNVEYFRDVRELLKQKLNRIPPIETFTELIGDKTILVIRVSEGKIKPYVNVQTKETFIRCGGSDVRPDPGL
jgi:predicted HTH transcriptional regulator